MLKKILKSEKKEKDKKKILILKKYDVSKDKKRQIIDQIKKFNNSIKIFQFHDKIKLGKLVVLKGPRYDEHKNLIPYSYIGPNRFLFTHRREALKNLSSIFKFESKYEKTHKEFNKTKSVTDIYSKLMRTFTHNFKNINEEKKSIKPLPNYLKKKLELQEKIIKRFGNYETEEKNLEQILIKKTNKNKNNLLLNFSDLGIYKKTEVINPNLENWNFKLRNPKEKGKYKRKGYFKATSLNDELYSVINLNKTKQIFINPFKNIYHKEKQKTLNNNKTKEENLLTLNLQGTKVLEKAVNNKRKKNELYESNSSKKSNKYKSLRKNNSHNDNLVKNLSENYDEKTFISDYNNKYEYYKTYNTTKLHN